MGDCGHLPATVPFPQRPIIILGSGIIGCAAARQLLLNGFSVVLVAEHLPGDQSIFYASAWAGAAWHAAGGISPEQRYLQAACYRHLLKMAREEPSSGVCAVQSREYLEQLPSENSSGWGRTILPKVIPQQSLASHYSNRDKVPRPASRRISVEF